MCNLIHEEIISHPITGSQEGQVRSVLPSSFPLLSMKQSLPGHLRYTKNPMLRQVRSQKKKKNKKKKKKKYLAYLGTLPTLPTLPPDQ